MPYRKSPAAPLWRNGKAKGEWVEIAFTAKAIALNLAVCKPHGDNQPFDLVTVTGSGRMARVQVRSSWQPRYPAETRYGTAYMTRPTSSKGFDFLAAYVPPFDAWYIVPAVEVHDNSPGLFYPHRPHSRGRLEKYRNAWRLLTGNPADDSRSHGLVIHA